MFKKTANDRRGYKWYGEFQEENDDDVGSDNDNYLVVK